MQIKLVIKKLLCVPFIIGVNIFLTITLMIVIFFAATYDTLRTLYHADDTPSFNDFKSFPYELYKAIRDGVFKKEELPKKENTEEDYEEYEVL